MFSSRPPPRPGAAFVLRYVLIPSLEGVDLTQVTVLPGPPSILQDQVGHLAHSFTPCSPVSPRGSFLVLLLRECFRDLSWLATLCHAGGDVGLLVTSIVPQTPFFWAMRITEVWACGGAPVGSVPSRRAFLGWGW